MFSKIILAVNCSCIVQGGVNALVKMIQDSDRAYAAALRRKQQRRAGGIKYRISLRTFGVDHSLFNFKRITGAVAKTMMKEATARPDLMVATMSRTARTSRPKRWRLRSARRWPRKKAQMAHW
jgi:hypothetical protein